MPNFNVFGVYTALRVMASPPHTVGYFYSKTVQLVQRWSLVSLIHVLSWINILGGIFLQIDKRPALNKCHGKKFLHFEPCFCNILYLFWWFPAQIELISWKFSKINYCPVPNKDVLGGKMLENNKNVMDFYLGHQSTERPVMAQVWWQ